jgi:glutamate/tyrosine decarboxylase-like PLP-dependent enzyme
MKELLSEVAARAGWYLEGLKERGVAASAEGVRRFYEPFPAKPSEPEEVLRLLDEVGSPATVGQAGGRFFGFVTGGSLPASLAANWLAGAWDQNSAFYDVTPATAALEEVAIGWLLEALGLPPEGGVGFVTGATMANFTALAAARHAVLEQAGWDVEGQGLFGAPPIKVIVGAEGHPSMFKALGMLGLGRERVIKVPVDGQGRMRAELLPEIAGPTIICTQAGNVNTGAFDPIGEICDRAHDAGAWVHVDGAFGLWARVAPERAYLVEGVEKADSWATDAHKWLNVPYDSGLAFARNREAMRAALSVSAAYLPEGERRDPYSFTPEMSRRARGVEIWAALKSLGREGLADLIERNCQYATRFAEGLKAAGYEILNEVTLNQVLVSFGEGNKTRRVIAAIQAEGTCWAGVTVWQGKTAMRISVSSWATTVEDVERSLEAMVRVARGVV